MFMMMMMMIVIVLVGENITHRWRGGLSLAGSSGSSCSSRSSQQRGVTSMQHIQTQC